MSAMWCCPQPLGAAAHLHVHPLHQRVLRPHVGDGAADGPAKAHGRGDAQLAAVGAGARDDVRYLVGARLPQSDAVELAPHPVERLLRHPAEGQVLLVRDARPTARVAAGHVRQLRELLRLDVSQGQLHRDHPVALLLLGKNVRLHPVVEVRRAPVGGVARVQRGSVQRLILQEEQRRRVEGLLRPRLLQLLLHQRAELVHPDAVDQELDPRPHPVPAQLVGAVEDPDDRLRHPQVLLHRHELVQRRRDPGHDGGPRPR